MNEKRVKEIQQETAYPESVSVQQALLKVWNECEQQKSINSTCTCGNKDVEIYQYYCKKCDSVFDSVE